MRSNRGRNRKFVESSRQWMAAKKMGRRAAERLDQCIQQEQTSPSSKRIRISIFEETEVLLSHPIQVVHHNIAIWWCFGSAWPRYLLRYIFELYLLQFWLVSHLCSFHAGAIALCWRNQIHCFVMFRSLGSSGRSRTLSCVAYAVLALLGYYFCWILVQGYFPSTSAQEICPRCSSASRCSISFYQSKRTICTSWHSWSLEASAQSAWWLRFETAISGKGLAWQNQRARTLPF